MLYFLIIKIFVTFEGATLLADFFLYSHDIEFLQNLVKNKNVDEAKSFNLTYRYVDDALSINDHYLGNGYRQCINQSSRLKRLRKQNVLYLFCLDLHLEFDNNCHLNTKMFDERDAFNSNIINFPYLCSNIPSSHAYGVYISQLIRYARAGTNYSDFHEHHKYLCNILLNQEYEEMRLKRSLTKYF